MLGRSRAPFPAPSPRHEKTATAPLTNALAVVADQRAPLVAGESTFEAAELCGRRSMAADECGLSETAEETFPLDSAARAAMQLAPPLHVTLRVEHAQTSPGSSALRASEVQAAAQALVERAAFWGDGTRGVARLRFGAGARCGLSGATVVLEHDGDRLSMRVEGADDASTAELMQRMRRKGIAVAD